MQSNERTTFPRNTVFFKATKYLPLTSGSINQGADSIGSRPLHSGGPPWRGPQPATHHKDPSVCESGPDPDVACDGSTRPRGRSQSQAPGPVTEPGPGPVPHTAGRASESRLELNPTPGPPASGLHFDRTPFSPLSLSMLHS